MDFGEVDVHDVVATCTVAVSLGSTRIGERNFTIVVPNLRAGPICGRKAGDLFRLCSRCLLSARHYVPTHWTLKTWNHELASAV